MGYGDTELLKKEVNKRESRFNVGQSDFFNDDMEIKITDEELVRRRYEL